MKKFTIIFPMLFIWFFAPIFLIGGWALVGIGVKCCAEDFESGAVSVSLLTDCILTIIFIVLAIFATWWITPHLGEIIITENSIFRFGLFVPFVRIKLQDIKYVDIRTFDDKAGNIQYYKGIQQMNIVDAYKFVLISENPLPRKSVNRIRSSRKNRLIKYAVSKKLCKVLQDKLPDNCKGPIDYQLFLYSKAKR